MKKVVKYKAGVVPCRKSHDRYKILIVSSRKFIGQWVFPVGTVEEGESFEQAAVRECMEESGYCVELGSKIDSFVINTDEDSAKFVFFQGLVVGESKVYEEDRERRWISTEDVVEIIAKPFKNTAEIVIRKLTIDK